MEYTFNCPHAGQDPNFRNVPAGYINKTVCGCGITSVAIEGDEDCVIAVPNVSLVINKISQYYNTQLETQGDPNSGARSRFGGEVFGVYGDIDEGDIYNYVQRVREAKTPIKVSVSITSRLIGALRMARMKASVTLSLMRVTNSSVICQ